MSTTSVQVLRTFPRSARHPQAAVYDCPLCSIRHWVPLSSATATVHCPTTNELITLDLAEAKKAGR
ncbi:hypothetical protein [Arthrobacter sp.]|uniref:hypothetical protein n=1 Tax=Arthrobacter sp. TaxID=1667 RepID=UPI003A91507F